MNRKKRILGFKVWIATILLAQNLAMTEKRAKQENAFSTPRTKAAGLKNHKRNNSKKATRRKDLPMILGVFKTRAQGFT